MLQLYKNIKQRRLELGLSQTELAKLVGYADKGMISRIENGKVDLPQSQIEKFAIALQTSPSYLMGWEDPILPSELQSAYISALDKLVNKPYYLNDETAEMAQELYADKNMRLLFDAAKNSKPQDLQMAADLLKRLKETNLDG